MQVDSVGDAEAGDKSTAQTDNDPAVFSGLVAHVKCQVIADLGADRNVITRPLLNRIRGLGNAVEESTLSTPVKIVTAFGDGAFQATTQVSLRLSIRVRHAAYLVLDRVTFLVVDVAPEDPRTSEVLVGKHTLRAWGIDARRTLNAVYDSLTVRRVAEEVALSWTAQQTEADQDLDDKTYEPYIDMEDETPAERSEALQAMFQRAADGGMSVEGLAGLKALVEEFADVFLVRLGNKPPARVPPMRVELKPGARPFQARPRHYSEAQRQWLRKYLHALESNGYIRAVQQAHWGSAPLLVAKGPPVYYRLTVDLRGVNSRTVTPVASMPHDSELAELRGMQCFGNLDLCAGYWQLPLHADDRAFFTLSTPFGSYEPCRVLQGAAGSAAFFQANMLVLTSGLDYKTWLDDLLAYARTEAALLATYRALFTRFRDKGLYLSIRKSNLYHTVARWCGKLIDAHGVKLDPRRISALQEMERPRDGAELSQLVHCLTWVSKNIPRFHELVAPLVACLEEVHRLAGDRKSKSAGRVALVAPGEPVTAKLQVAWGAGQDACFHRIKATLAKLVTLAHVDPQKVTCVYTDSSDHLWSGVVTQVTDPELPLREQDHVPLSFIGGRWSKTEQRWSTYEREACAVITTMEKLDWIMLTSKRVLVYTDHRNLLWLYQPSSVLERPPQFLVSKAVRWAIRLSAFTYDIYHLEGPKNEWADGLTRWMRGYRGPKSSGPEEHGEFRVRRMETRGQARAAQECDETQGAGARREKVEEQMSEPRGPDLVRKDTANESRVQTEAQQSQDVGRVRESRLKQVRLIETAEDVDFEWPTTHEVRKAQQEAAQEMPKDAVKGSDGIVRMRSRVYVPASRRLRERLLVIAHGSGGHRGRESTLASLRDYTWPSMKEDVAAWVAGCLVCGHADPRSQILRMRGHQMHAERPGQMLHVDYIYMGEGSGDLRYVLMVLDDFSRYVWFKETTTCDSHHVVRTLLEWIKVFTAPVLILSDQGSHFMAEVVKGLESSWGIQHKATCAYSPWSNGTVERCGHELVRMMRGALTEKRLPVKDWPMLIATVQGLLNTCPNPRFDGLSSLEAFCGMVPRLPIDRVLETPEARLAAPGHDLAILRKQNVEHLRSSLNDAHETIRKKIDRRRRNEINSGTKSPWFLGSGGTLQSSTFPAAPIGQTPFRGSHWFQLSLCCCFIIHLPCFILARV